MQIKRRKTRVVYKGKVPIGGDNPIAIQSMTNTRTDDVKATVGQIKKLTAAGCDIVRVAVPDEKAANALGDIKKQIKIPLVADIHFNAKLALIAINQGVDAIRINPGNITDKNKVKEIVSAAKDKNIAIRIGLNSGSVIRKTGDVSCDMVHAALEYVNWFESWNFKNIIISLKSSTILETIEAYKEMSKACDYPLHVGVTSAGTLRSGTVKSALGIGTLLMQGIGDTIRVSLTYEPVEEVKVGYEILSSLELRNKTVPEIVSCPTCGRCSVDLIKIVNKVEKRVSKIHKPLKLAVMGCVVNGPGEAKEVDVGLAWGSSGCALLFKKGIKDKKLEGTCEEIIQKFIKEILDVEC